MIDLRELAFTCQTLLKTTLESDITGIHGGPYPLMDVPNEIFSMIADCLVFGGGKGRIKTFGSPNNSRGMD
jgi:hypothetical protein